MKENEGLKDENQKLMEKIEQLSKYVDSPMALGQESTTIQETPFKETCAFPKEQAKDFDPFVKAEEKEGD
jgi:cell division septum initiation protein DivIVA